ncbi:ROK family protein [Lacticaseibacillus daqingensis]|uniref:ROK family protein n=1 Tax=Lacticaseibacillus daqingensis TaxID=2486014 RepID=UPI000F7B788E|nr:ROK family protein [Lacticaseibacillus daqingensis]
MTNYVAFDIGGTNTQYALVTDTGALRDQGSFPTGQMRQDNLNALVKTVARYQADADIAGIGVSAPGIITKDGYMITGGAVMSLYEFPLAQTLSDMLDLPVHVENDANAAAIAEHWLGNAQDVSDYICLVLGTGIGGGIVLNNAVYRGAHGMAGEIGWSITHDLDYTHNFEAASLNFSAAVVSGLVRRYNASLAQFSPMAQPLADAADILALAHEHDRIASPIYRQYLDDVTVMLLNLIGTLDPERILIGGGISANDRFMAELQVHFDEFIARHESLNRVSPRLHFKLMPAGLRNNAGLIGAVYPLTQA